MAPKDMPRGIINQINRSINEALKDPDFAKYLADNVYEPGGGTPEELASLMRDTANLWGATDRKARYSAELIIPKDQTMYAEYNGSLTRPFVYVL